MSDQPDKPEDGDAAPGEPSTSEPLLSADDVHLPEPDVSPEAVEPELSTPADQLRLDEPTLGAAEISEDSAQATSLDEVAAEARSVAREAEEAGTLATGARTGDDPAEAAAPAGTAPAGGTAGDVAEQQDEADLPGPVEAADETEVAGPVGRVDSHDSVEAARLSFADERVEQREVELPGAKARYLRLLWQAPQQAPALVAARVVSIENQELAPPLAWSAQLAPTTSRVGEYSWELPLSLPLERVRVSLPQGNVLAPVSLSSRGAGKLEWQSLTSGLLYRLPQGGKEVLQDEIELWGTPVQQLRLRIDARGGGLGKDAPSLQVAVRGTQVVFLARGSAPYRLAVGDASARSAALPLGTLIPGYEPKRLAGLGRATAPDAVPTAVREAADAAQSAADWKRIGLWAVLLVGVALLGGMAFSLLRKPAVSEH